MGKSFLGRFICQALRSSLEIFKVDPSALSKDFTEEVSFVAHVRRTDANITLYLTFSLSTR